jgi:Xaa-Pro aminopeptidase
MKMVNDVHDKVKAILAESQLSAILVFGADNVQYLAGAPLPFLPLFPDRPVAVLWGKGEEPVAVCPDLWETAVISLSRVKRTWGYDEKPGDPTTAARAVTKLVEALIPKGGFIGVDLDRISVRFCEALKTALKEYTLVSCDAGLRELRAVKTMEELELLEEVAYRVDQAIFGVAHHVLVTSSRSEMSLGEELRVHAFERELDVVGGHSISQGASGENAEEFWPGAPEYGIGFNKKLAEGEFVRMEIRYSLNGYWSDGTRLLTMGEATPEQTKVFDGLTDLREAAMKAAKPGVKASEVYSAVKAEAEKRKLDLYPGLAVGHGVGISSYEPPYISGSDQTVLHLGMVIVLDPVIKGPDGELLWSKETIIITDSGCRHVGWYVDWRKPYVANYTL